MSWDLSVLEFPVRYASVADIPSDAKTIPLKRSEIIARIKAAIPSADFSNPSWGIVDGNGWSIEVNIGKNEDLRSFGLHVRGGGGAIATVLRLLDALKLRAIDIQTGDFLSADSAADSFGQWSSYRDQVISEYRKQQSFFQRLLSRLRPS